MIEDIGQMYEEIASSMVEGIHEEWSSAKFEVIFFPDSSVYEAEYVRKSDGVCRGFTPSSMGPRAFRRLRQSFKNAGKKLWGKVRFDLQPNGQFHLSWGYEDCDDDGNALFNEDDEVERREARHRRLSAK